VIELLPYATVALLVLALIRVELISKQIAGLREELAALHRHHGLADPLSAEPSQKVRQLAADPKGLIEAIRTYRQESGADLRRAKEVVEGLRTTRGDA
jgi:ribosomal protein L7/L12